jgi:hypothetical protein
VTEVFYINYFGLLISLGTHRKCVSIFKILNQLGLFCQGRIWGETNPTSWGLALPNVNITKKKTRFLG